MTMSRNGSTLDLHGTSYDAAAAALRAADDATHAPPPGGDPLSRVASASVPVPITLLHPKGAIK